MAQKNNGLLIVGAGGQGKVIADVVRTLNKWEHIAFLDDKFPVISSVLDLPVIGRVSEGKQYCQNYADVVIAIGENELRQRLLYQFEAWGFNLPSIVHSSAYVSISAKIGKGTVVFPQAVINAEARVGNGCIINTGAIIEHDCILGEGVHISPGVCLGGEVKIGNFSWIGIGANVKNNINIGNKVIVGAGAMVVKHVLDNLTVMGVPARINGITK